MNHDELVAKRNAIKAQGNWDSTKPMQSAKWVAKSAMTYRIEMKESGDVDFKTIDHLKSKKQAMFYLKEYKAYKPNNEFRVVEHQTGIVVS